MSSRAFVFIAVLFGVSGAFASSNASPRSSEVECRQVDRVWHPWSNVYGRWIGEVGGRHGFPNQQSCQWSINEAVKAGQDVICAANAGGFAPIYLPTNRPVTDRDIGYVWVKDCIEVIETHANGMMCGYDGQFWVAYDIKTGADRCEGGMRGYRTQDACLNFIRHQPAPQPQPGPQSKPRLSCEWNRYSWQPFNRGVGFIGLDRYGFYYVQDCERTISMAHDRVVCNWDGAGFRAYDVWTNATLSAYPYGSLEACYASVP